MNDAGTRECYYLVNRFSNIISLEQEQHQRQQVDNKLA